MATTNVKILLRRGLREHIGVDTLDTGEMGFAYDTNQVFIGIDEAIDEVQFDVFANAHAIIQTWLDSDDNPYQHLDLRVDEDLVIRGVPDVDVMIGAMHFYLQDVEWDGEVDFTPGEIIYLKQFVYADDRVLSSEIDKGKTYVIKVLGNTDYTLLGAEENKVNVKFTATATGPLNGDGEVLQVVDVEDYTQGSVVSTSYDPECDRTGTTIYLRHNSPIFAQDIAPQRDFYNMNKSEWGLFEWSGTEWVHHVIDNVYDAGSTEPINSNIDYTGNVVKPIDSDGIIGDVSVVIGDGAVRYWKKKDWGWSLLGNDHFVTGNADIQNDITTHHLPDNLVDAFEFDPNGRWEVTITKFKGTPEETTHIYQHSDIIDRTTLPNMLFWYFDTGEYGYDGEPIVHGDIKLPDEKLVNGRDEVTIRYFYELEDFQFHTTDIDTQDLIPTPLEKPDQRSNGDPLRVGDYYVDYSRDLQQSLKLIISEFDSLEPRIASLPEEDGTSSDGYDDIILRVWKEQLVNTIDYNNVIMKIWRLQPDGSKSWEQLNFTVLNDTPGTGNVAPVNSAGVAYPLETYGNDYEYAIVTHGTVTVDGSVYNDIKFFQKVSGVWAIISGRNMLTGELNISDTEPTGQELGDFWVTVPYTGTYSSPTWETIDLTILNTNNVEPTNNAGIAYPSVSFGNDYDHVAVTSTGEVKFFQKISGIWALISGRNSFTGELNISDTEPTNNIQLGDYWATITESLSCSDPDTMDINELDKYFRYNDTFIPIYLTEKIALQDMLPYQLLYGRPEVDSGTATITIRERDWDGHLSFTDYDYNNMHRSLYYTKNRIGSPEQEDFADTIYVEHAEIPEFEAPYYARSRRNVEVITENSYNQLFADQHLSALSHHTGRRSSLFKKIYSQETGVFLRYLHDVCSTFFVDYSLIQKNSSKTFLRVGQLKVINGYPHGMQFAKLTDDHTEMWQDFNNDNFAEMYPEQEFSNIQFDVKREDIIRVANQTELAINNWFETPMNTSRFVGKTKQVGDDVIITSQDPLWDYTTVVNDLVNSLQTATTEKGEDLQIYFQQDPGYNVEISYTVKRWSM